VTSGDSPGFGGSRQPIVVALERIRLAATFLTILPLGSSVASPDDVAASLGWFPLVGFVIGAALAFEQRLLIGYTGNTIAAILVIATLTLSTGAVHLDGLADTADALGAGGDKTRALEIMRDSRIGSYGAVSLILILALKVAAIAGAHGAARQAAIYAAPGLARWVMVAVPYRLDYLRAAGAGTSLLAQNSSHNLMIASAVAFFGILPIAGFHALGAVIVTLAITILSRRFLLRWLGGVTGDTIGAAGEIVETAVLIAIAR
jgi:adenosylcobinamide-GDP ribazoletransferase